MFFNMCDGYDQIGDFNQRIRIVRRCILAKRALKIKYPYVSLSNFERSKN